jgi:SAM-dependent methyltransferase
MSDIRKSVEIVGEHWIASAYYADAERHTHIFWDAGSPFRQLYTTMDTSGSVLELASGHAEKVAPSCKRLVLMDIHQSNLEVCRNRLRHHPHVEYYRNSGFDFWPLGRDQLKAIYCYDAMVHFSPDIVLSYLVDTARVLQPGGMALYHHSNYPAPLDKPYGQNPHARNHMTFPLFCSYADQAMLEVVESKELDWGNVRALDRLTLLRRPDP